MNCQKCFKIFKDGHCDENSSTDIALKNEDNESAKISDPLENKTETQGIVVGKVNDDEKNGTENGNAMPVCKHSKSFAQIQILRNKIGADF